MLSRINEEIQRIKHFLAHSSYLEILLFIIGKLFELLKAIICFLFLTPRLMREEEEFDFDREIKYKPTKEDDTSPLTETHLNLFYGITFLGILLILSLALQ